MIIVADTGPLIALARIQRLSLLQQLYGEALIPPAVQHELQLSSHRPGAQVLILAFCRATGTGRHRPRPAAKGEAALPSGNLWVRGVSAGLNGYAC